MKLQSIQIKNYKCFRDSGQLKLSPGFNIVIGENNSGKTALLDAATFTWRSVPHLSTTSKPAPQSPIDPHSVVTYTIAGSPDDLHRAISPLTGTIGVPTDTIHEPTAQSAQAFFASLLREGFVFETVLSNGAVTSAIFKSPAPLQDQLTPVFQFEVQPGRPLDLNKFLPVARITTTQRLERCLANTAQTDAYGFRAERLNIGRSAFGTGTTLGSDARNLPEVVNNLQSNSDLFEEYIRLVRRVLPNVLRLSPVSVDGSQVELRVWGHEPSTRRDDLAIPLMQGGTGLSQVAAMLYVVATATTPRTIIIDEPSSFLHPGAVRELLAILIEHPMHQYIISTHSPQVIASLPDDAQVLQVNKRGFESSVTTIDIGTSTGARAALDSVGARLSDVFGIEQVLWVEGPTEERCFELLRSRKLGRLRADVLIRGVVATGDFQRKTIGMTTQVYRRLSESRALVPAAVGFLFDKEKLSPDDQRELQESSHGAISFIPARMYECYLLNADRLAARLRERGETQLESKRVDELLQIKMASKKFGGGPEADFRSLDAAKILEELFEELTENRRRYSKIEDGYALTRKIVEDGGTDLDEIVECLRAKLDACPPRPSSK